MSYMQQQNPKLHSYFLLFLHIKVLFVVCIQLTEKGHFVVLKYSYSLFNLLYQLQLIINNRYNKRN